MKRTIYITLVGLPALLVFGVVGKSAKSIEACCTSTRLFCARAIRHVMAAGSEKKSD